MYETGNIQLVLRRAGGGAWQGRANIRIRDQHDRLLYNRCKRYVGPVRFVGLARVPSGRHLFHVHTRQFLPVSCYRTVRADEETVPIPMVVRPSVADANGASIAYPSFDQLSVDLPEIANLEAEVGPVQGSFEFPVRNLEWAAYYDQLVGDRAGGNSDQPNHRRLACLLNLYSKMTQFPQRSRTTQGTLLGIDPALGVRRPWDLLCSVLRIDQDRIYGLVKPGLDVPAILKALRNGSNAVFQAHDAGQHDIPVPPGFEKHDVTFKTDRIDKAANLQLSFASRRTDSGTTWIVDADIDKSTGFAHSLEAIHNWLTSDKTDPYAVHELLATEGYTLPYALVVPELPSAATCG